MKNISATKAIGQLKRSGERGRLAKAGKNDAALRGYADQAFTQRQGQLDNIDIKTPDDAPEGEEATSGPNLDGSAYSTQQGQYIQDENGICPEGMVEVGQGACQPVYTGDTDATAYKELVARAWYLIEKAQEKVERLDFVGAAPLSEEVEDIGITIKEKFGQSMQGDIIEYWGDMCDEMLTYHKAEKKARKKKRLQMDPHIDEDVQRDMRKAGREGYSE